MTRVTVVNRSRGTVLGDRVGLAATRWTRLRGFLARPMPRSGEGLLFLPSKGVHMYGMRYPLDVLLLDESGRVLSAYPALRPWKRTPLLPRARAALEVPVGRIAATQTREGDLLEWRRGAP